MTQPEDGEQELVVGFEVEVVTAADGALAVGAVETAAVVGSERGTQVLEQLVEDGDGDAGEVAEDGRETAQAGKP